MFGTRQWPGVTTSADYDLQQLLRAQARMVGGNAGVATFEALKVCLVWPVQVCYHFIHPIAHLGCCLHTLYKLHASSFLSVCCSRCYSFGPCSKHIKSTSLMFTLALVPQYAVWSLVLIMLRTLRVPAAQSEDPDRLPLVVDRVDPLARKRPSATGKCVLLPCAC